MANTTFSSGELVTAAKLNTVNPSIIVTGGTTARTLADRFLDVVNVLDFGASTSAASGTTTNRVAFQAAIDVAETAGDMVVIPAGNYNVDGTIVLKSNVALVGENNAILTATGNRSDYTTAVIRNENYETAAGNVNMRVENLKIVGMDTEAQSDSITIVAGTNNGIGGIYFIYVSGCLINNVRTQDTWSGIVVNSVPTGVPTREASNEVTNCEVLRAQAWSMTGNSGRPRGIYMGTAGRLANCESRDSGTGFYVTGNNLTVENCSAVDPFVDNGYYIIAENTHFVNCRSVNVPYDDASTDAGDDYSSPPADWFGSGFTIAYNKNGSFTGCLAEGCGNMGFRIHVKQSQTRIIGCQAIDCGYGFRIDNTSYVYTGSETPIADYFCSELQLIGNIAQDSKVCGFQFTQMRNSIVSGNIVKNSNRGGVSTLTRGALTLYNYCLFNLIMDNVAVDDQAVATSAGLYEYSNQSDEGGVGGGNEGNIIRNMQEINVATRSDKVSVISDKIQIWKDNHKVYNSAGTDVDTITCGGSEGFIGQSLLLRRDPDSTGTATFKDGVDNLRLVSDFAFDAADDSLFLLYDGSNWIEISRSSNA